MKNYDETINTVFGRICEYETERKKRKIIITRTVAPLCCLCLIALIGIGVWQSDIFNTEPPAVSEDSTVANKTDNSDNIMDGAEYAPGKRYGKGEETPPDGTTSATSSVLHTDNTEPEKQLCFVNEIQNIITSADIAGPYPFSEHYLENWDNDKMLAYLGIDLNEVEESFNLDSYNHGAWFRKDTNTLVSDYAHFAYSNKKISFNLSASKTSAPVDCLIIPNEDVRETNIGTNNHSVKVKFYGTVGSDSTEQPEIQSTMIADFENNGVYFRVESQNISVYNFYKIVTAIINA